MGVATSVCSMMTGMFVTAIDGFNGLKISLSIAGTIGGDITKLVFGPKMAGLELSADFTNAPCLTAYGGAAYLFYPDGNELKYASYGPTGWSTAPMTVQGAQPMAGASAVAFNDLLYVFYQGPSQGLWYNVFNGAGWSDPMQVTFPSGNPSLAASSSTCSGTIVGDIARTNIPMASQYASAPSAVVFDTQLYVFYQGSSGQALRYSVFNGTTWIEDVAVPNAGLSCSPSAVVYNGMIYVVYQGSELCGSMYCSVYNGSWSHNDPGVGVSSSPQAGVFNGNIVVVHQGAGNSTDLYYLYFNGSTWSSDMQLLPISLSYGPAPVVFNGELMVFMQDKNTQGELYYTTSNGNAWQPMSQVPGVSLSNQPAPVVFNDQLYVFYADPSESKIYYSRCTTNWSWSSAKALNTVCISSGPSALCYQDQIVCLFQNQTQLFCTMYDASADTWTPPAPLPVNVIGAASAISFAAAGGSSQLYVFYQAAGASGEVNQLWYITLDLSTLSYSTPTQIPNASILGNPSAVILNAELCVFYQSAGTCWQAISADGSSWTLSSTGIQLKESPAAVVLDGAPYFFYQGATNNNLYVAQPASQGEPWTETVFNDELYGSPAAAVFNDQIYVFFQGGNDNGYFYCFTYPCNPSASNPVTLLSGGMSGSPAAATGDGQLHVFYEGPSNNGSLHQNSMSSNGTWAGDSLVQSTVPLGDPALVSYQNVMYCFYESYGQLCYSINAGGTSLWTTQQLVPNVSLQGTPSAAVFNDVIYIFYQSANGGQLFYVTCDQGSFSSPAAVPGASITVGQSPSATVFNNLLYVFYPNGTTTASAITYSVFNGSSWGEPVAPIGGMSYSPSTVVFAPQGESAQLYVFYQQENATAGLYYNVFDGTSWSSNSQVPIALLTGSPSAAATPNCLYVAYQGCNNCGEVWYSVLQNGSWGDSYALPGAEKMTGSPALAALNTYSVWAVYASPAGQLFCNVLSGVNSWETQIQLIPENLDSSTNLLSDAPSAAVYNGKIYVAYKAYGHNNMWYNASSDGNSWGAQTKASGGGMNGSPSLVVYNNQLYMFHTGDSNDGILCCTVMSSGETWCNDTQIYCQDEPIKGAANYGPAAAVFGGQIYCFTNASSSQLGCATIDTSVTFGENPPSVPFLVLDNNQAVQSNAPGAVTYNGTLYAFINSPSLFLQYFTSTNPGSENSSAWSSLQQAGFGSVTNNGGGTVLEVAVEQTAAIAEPFIDAYLVPSNLANTAFLKQGENGKPQWVKPTWNLVTEI